MCIRDSISVSRRDETNESSRYGHGEKIEAGQFDILYFFILCFTPPSGNIKYVFLSAMFLPWLSGEFSLFPSRRLIQISMKDDSIMAKLGHHKELFANYCFFVAK